MRTARFIPCVGIAAACALPAFAQISFPNFSDSTGLQLNGNASTVGGVLRVTPATYYQAGSAFSTTTVPLASNGSFSTFFKFRISGSGGSGDEDGWGADGITFVVQTVSNSIGSSGGGIGYFGIPNSLGVEYDTWDNGPGSGDPNGNHVNVNLGGSFSPASDAAMVPNRMNDGTVWSSWVDYNGATDALEVRLVEGSNVRPVDALISKSVDLPAVLGSTNAFVGFTSGTGFAFGNHDILRWEFRNSFDPIGEPPGITPVPETSTYGLLAAAMLAVGVIIRRRKVA
jgi:hypothetical protein